MKWGKCCVLPGVELGGAERGGGGCGDGEACSLTTLDVTGSSGFPFESRAS